MCYSDVVNRKICTTCLAEKENTNENFPKAGNLKYVLREKTRRPWKPREILSARCKACTNRSHQDRRAKRRLLSPPGPSGWAGVKGWAPGFRKSAKEYQQRALFRRLGKTEWDKLVQRRLRSGWRYFRRVTGIGAPQKPKNLGLGKWKVQAMNKRAVKFGRLERVSLMDLRILMELQKGICFYCAVELGKDLHVDHKMPLSRGGTNGRDNLCLSCPKCNLDKHTLTEQEFRQWKGMEQCQSTL